MATSPGRGGQSLKGLDHEVVRTEGPLGNALLAPLFSEGGTETRTWGDLPKVTDGVFILSERLWFHDTVLQHNT